MKISLSATILRFFSLIFPLLAYFSVVLSQFHSAMLDRILIFTPSRLLAEQTRTALDGLGAELVTVALWSELEEELRQRGAVLALLLSPLRGVMLAERVASLRSLSPRLELFTLWWDDSLEGAVERLLCGVNQIYTLPCSAERLRRHVTSVLQKHRGCA